MKKSFNVLMCAAMSLTLAACQNASVSTAGSEAIYTAGTYSASAQGHSSDVTVTATLSETAIESVELDVSGETETPGQAAADDLVSEIMEKQSADIDGVSGATETSTAVKMAMKDILAQAGGTSASKEKTPLTDGVYDVSAQSFGFLGDMEAKVTIEDNAVTDIDIYNETDSLTGQWFSVAEELLIPRIIDYSARVSEAFRSSNAPFRF